MKAVLIEIYQVHSMRSCMKSIIIIFMYILSTLTFGCSDSPKEVVEPIETLTLAEPSDLDLIPMHLMDGRLTVYVPPGFQVCTDTADWVTKPDLFSMLLCHETGGVRVGVYESEKPVLLESTEKLLQKTVSSLKNKAPFADLYRNEIMILGERQCMVLDYRITVGRIETRTLCVGMIMEDLILTVFFETTLEFEYDWLDRGLCIVSSIEVNR